MIFPSILLGGMGSDCESRNQPVCRQ